MTFDPQKMYPYPVLRPQSEDYPLAEFQVKMDVGHVGQTTALTVEAEFMLSDPDLLRLVEEGHACYVLQVRAPWTYFRSALFDTKNRIRKHFSPGLIAGRTEFSPYLVATGHVHDFCASGWHADYSGMSFDIVPGMVLAVDRHEEYTVDTGERASIGSIFQLFENSKLSGGIWTINHDGDRVTIEMSSQDYARFKAARESVNNHPDAAYIMNSIYLPALIWLLQEGDKDKDEMDDRRWFRALNARLEDKILPILGKPSNRLVDAQILLDYPFAKLPLLSEQDALL